MQSSMHKNIRACRHHTHSYHLYTYWDVHIFGCCFYLKKKKKKKAPASYLWLIWCSVRNEIPERGCDKHDNTHRERQD